MCELNQEYWGVFYFLGDFDYGPFDKLVGQVALRTSAFMRGPSKHCASVGENWKAVGKMSSSHFIRDGRWFLFSLKNVDPSCKMLFVPCISMAMKSESKISNCACVVLVRMDVFFCCWFSKLSLTCLIYFIMKLKRRVTSPFNFSTLP